MGYEHGSNPSLVLQDFEGPFHIHRDYSFRKACKMPVGQRRRWFKLRSSRRIYIHTDCVDSPS